MENKQEQGKYFGSTRLALLSVIGVTVLVVATVCLSFATYKDTGTDNTSNSVSTGSISMYYSEDVNGISLVNSMPISDVVGKALKGPGEYFDFSVNSTVKGSVNLTYEISAEKYIDSTIKDSDIKLYLEQQVSGTYEQVMAPTVFTPLQQTSEIGSPAGTMLLKTVTKNETSTDNYRLRMWINESAVVDEAQTYSVRINVYGKAK